MRASRQPSVVGHQPPLDIEALRTHLIFLDGRDVDFAGWSDEAWLMVIIATGTHEQTYRLATRTTAGIVYS